MTQKYHRENRVTLHGLKPCFFSVFVTHSDTAIVIMGTARNSKVTSPVLTVDS